MKQLSSQSDVKYVTYMKSDFQNFKISLPETTNKSKILNNKFGVTPFFVGSII